LRCLPMGDRESPRTCASLADGLGKRRRQPVETLSASLVSFALARRNGAKDCVSLENPPELRELVAAMRVAVAPDLERAKDWRPVPFPPEAPAAGTLGELQVRATLLALAERPRLAREEELRRIASWPAPFATLAAFRARQALRAGQGGRARACRCRPRQLPGRCEPYRGRTRSPPAAWRGRRAPQRLARSLLGGRDATGARRGSRCPSRAHAGARRAGGGSGLSPGCIDGVGASAAARRIARPSSTMWLAVGLLRSHGGSAASWVGS
jgi:hypothetical protein